MEEEKVEEKNENKKSSKVLVIVTFITIGLTFFISGYNVRGMFNDNKEETVKKEEKEEEKKEEPTESTVSSDVPYSDKVVYGSYGDIFTLYLIDNGSVYYKTSASRFAGLNVCPTKEEYCKSNTSYNNDMVKISDIENVKRLKYVSDLDASDERFIVYAITNNGEVYTISGSTATKTDLTNIDNLMYVDYDEKYYEFTTKDGKTIKKNINIEQK
jgi:hypothetical protein